MPIEHGLPSARDRHHESFPIKSRKLVRGVRNNHWLWLEADGAVWLEQRPDTGVWAGLWTLPLFDDQAALTAALRAATIGGSPEALPPIAHALTHFEWHLQAHRLRLPAHRQWRRATGPAGALGEPGGPGGRSLARAVASLAHHCRVSSLIDGAPSDQGPRRPDGR